MNLKLKFGMNFSDGASSHSPSYDRRIASVGKGVIHSLSGDYVGLATKKRAYVERENLTLQGIAILHLNSEPTRSSRLALYRVGTK